MPMPGLHEIVTAPAAYTELLLMCQGAGSPTKSNAEFVAKSPTRNKDHAAAETPPAFVVVPALEFVGATSPEDPRIQALLQGTDGSRQRAAGLVVDGALQAFHSGCFPEGHRQTNLALWAALPPDAAPYEVMYADGYEPYGFFCRRYAPPFDERFRGFGLDKVREKCKRHKK